jgi:hypothetical protein
MNKQLIALHMSADTLIWLSYVAIALTLTYMVRRARREIPFSWLFLALGVHHRLRLYPLHGNRRSSGNDPIGWPDIKLLTAVASPVTCLLSWIRRNSAAGFFRPAT